MQPPQHRSRINLAELKEQIVRRVGMERSKQYFYYLNRLLCLKLSKVEFNQLCVRIVGKDNVHLHNQFIRSILKNACRAKAPPPANDRGVVKAPAKVGEKASVLQTSSSPGLSNRDILPHLPVSPRKARTNRKHGDLAPFGIPFLPVSIGGARRSSFVSTRSKCISASSCAALLDGITLREHMEQIARTQGLEGVSVDSANLLNNGLNSYLMGIIGSCIAHVGARFGHELEKNHAKLVNGMRINHQFQMQNSGIPSDVLCENKRSCLISIHDLRVAMELNPQQLGEDWPVLLEKICIQSYDE